MRIVYLALLRGAKQILYKAIESQASNDSITSQLLAAHQEQEEQLHGLQFSFDELSLWLNQKSQLAALEDQVMAARSALSILSEKKATGKEEGEQKRKIKEKRLALHQLESQMESIKYCIQEQQEMGIELIKDMFERMLEYNIDMNSFFNDLLLMVDFNLVTRLGSAEHVPLLRKMLSVCSEDELSELYPWVMRHLLRPEYQDRFLKYLSAVLPHQYVDICKWITMYFPANSEILETHQEALQVVREEKLMSTTVDGDRPPVMPFAFVYLFMESLRKGLDQLEKTVSMLRKATTFDNNHLHSLEASLQVFSYIFVNTIQEELVLFPTLSKQLGNDLSVVAYNLDHQNFRENFKVIMSLLQHLKECDSKVPELVDRLLTTILVVIELQRVHIWKKGEHIQPLYLETFPEERQIRIIRWLLDISPPQFHTKVMPWILNTLEDVSLATVFIRVMHLVVTRQQFSDWCELMQAKVFPHIWNRLKHLPELNMRP